MGVLFKTLLISAVEYRLSPPGGGTGDVFPLKQALNKQGSWSSAVVSQAML